MHGLRLWFFTYYELPLAAGTLLSLRPLENCACAARLEATCLAPQPGEYEEEGREEVEEEPDEEELAEKRVQCLWPSGLCQEPFKSWDVPHL